MDMSGKRLYYLDYLRIAATFAVIVVHVAAQRWYSDPVQSYEWQVYNWYDSAVRFCVPVFCMISGALFLDRNRKVSAGDIYRKYIPRIVTAYLVWTFAYNYRLLIGGGDMRSAINGLITGRYHFWYMPMTIGLYVLIPLIRKITEEEWLERYFLAVGFVLAFLFPTAISYLKILPATKDLFFLPYCEEFFTRMDFRFAAGYVYYFVLGHYLSAAKMNRFAQFAICSLGIASAAAIALCTGWYSGLMEKASEAFYGYLGVPVALSAAGVFVLVKGIFGRVQRDNWLNRFVVWTSNRCFGVYLVHVLVMERFVELLQWHSASRDPLYNIPALSLAIFVVSLCISAVLSKITVLKKYIV